MTGLFEESVRVYLAQARTSLARAKTSLNLLKNQDSDYAHEHRMLIAPLEQVVAIWSAQSGCVADANEGQAKCKKEELRAADKGEASHTENYNDIMHLSYKHLRSGCVPLPDEIVAFARAVLASHSQSSGTAKDQTIMAASALPSNEAIRATDTGD